MFNRITFSPDIMAGKACIRGMRIPVSVIVNQIAHGVTLLSNHTTSGITFVEIHELNLPEGRVILFQIPPAPVGIPIAWKGHYYGRNDEELSPLNIQEIEQLKNQTKQYDWSTHICERATMSDINSDAILKARKEYKISHEVHQYLRKRKLTEGRYPNIYVSVR